MSTYEASELLQRWKNGKLDANQVLGHILQHLILLYAQDSELFSRTAEHKASLEDLSNRMAGQTEQHTPSPPQQRRRKR